MNLTADGAAGALPVPEHLAAFYTLVHKGNNPSVVFVRQPQEWPNEQVFNKHTPAQIWQVLTPEIQAVVVMASIMPYELGAYTSEFTDMYEDKVYHYRDGDIQVFLTDEQVAALQATTPPEVDNELNS